MNTHLPPLIDYLVEESIVSLENAHDALKKTNSPIMTLEHLIHEHNLNTQLILELCAEKFKLNIIDPKSPRHSGEREGRHRALRQVPHLRRACAGRRQGRRRR